MIDVSPTGEKLIPETEAALRINAMANEYKAAIAGLSERCAMLAVANALANARIAELEKPKEVANG